MRMPHIHIPAILKATPRKEGKIRKIGMSDLPTLAAALSAQSGLDPYALSAAYYGYTGRHGLWVYEEGEDFIPFCLHPNVPGKILLFPGVGLKGALLARNFLRDGFMPGNEVQLARIDAATSAELANRLTWTSPAHSFESQDEAVLDWLYPVHTLSTALVCAHEGGAFKDFRKNTHRVDAGRITVMPLDIDAHYFDLLSLSQAWARDHASAAYSVQDLLEPHTYIIKMIRESGLDLQGSVIFMDGHCVSFAAWEMPVVPSLPAVSVASLSHGPSKGLSELQYLEMCRALAGKGIERVCIGGSETASLDAYKRKMNPVESVSLKSIAVLSTTDQAFNGFPTNTSLSAPSKIS